MVLLATKVWKTISLGTVRTAVMLKKAIENLDHEIDKWSNEIILGPNFKINEKGTTTDLVIKSVSELGFDTGARLREIIEKTCGTKEKVEVGFVPCENEVGPQLCMQGNEALPENEWVFVVSKLTLIDPKNRPVMFRLKRSKRVILLTVINAEPDCFLGPRNKFVFALPQK